MTATGLGQTGLTSARIMDHPLMRPASSTIQIDNCGPLDQAGSQLVGLLRDLPRQPA